MKKKYYWKVVKMSGDEGTFISSVITTGKYRLMYRIGVMTKSVMDENGIFVFNTRQQARRWRKVFVGESKILKVEALGDEMPIIMYDFLGLKHNNFKYRDFDTPIPNGTVTFPSVIPLEISR